MSGTSDERKIKQHRYRPALLLACILVLCSQPVLAQDPWATFNKPVFLFNKAFDGMLIKPVAKVYDRYTPVPAKTGVRNFFSNMSDVNVVVNDFLQLKWRQGLNDTGRLILNTTLGIGGLFDVGTAVGLDKHYEDFGQTLGYWGVGDGGYLVLPVLGASTLRDAIALFPDMALNPLRLVEDNKVQASLFVLGMVDTRISYFAAENMIRGDEYSFVRNAFLQRREYLVQDGEVYDEFDEF